MAALTRERNRRVLIVDDNRAIHDDFRKILRVRPNTAVSDLETELFGAEPPPALAFELDSAYQGADGVELVRAALATGRPYALAVVDMRMPPGIDGLHTIARMWEIDPDLQVVICTAYSDASWQDLIRRFGATDRLLILKKPFDLAEVCQLALALTQKWELAREARMRMAELVQSRAELAASLALAQAVQEATTDGLLVVGTDRRVSTANRRFLELWGISPELIATGDAKLILGSVLDQVVDPDGLVERIAYFYGHPDEAGSDELRLKDGRVFERWTGPVRSADGPVHGRLWWFRDITERRRLELDRAVVYRAHGLDGPARRGRRPRDQQPADLRARQRREPARASDGCRHARRRPASSPSGCSETRDGLARIRVIVRDLQTLARVRRDAQRGRPPAGRSSRRSRSPAPSSATARRSSGATSRSPPVLGSRIRLGQVFFNLIINAAQAIPEGQAASNRIEIAIRDTGAPRRSSTSPTPARDRARAPRADLRPVLHHQGRRRRDRAGALDLARDRRRPPRHARRRRSTLGVGTTMTVTLPHAERAPSRRGARQRGGRRRRAARGCW